MEKTAITGMGVMFGHIHSINEFKQHLFYSNGNQQDRQNQAWISKVDLEPWLAKNPAPFALGRQGYCWDELLPGDQALRAPGARCYLQMLAAAGQALKDARLSRNDLEHTAVITGLDIDAMASHEFEATTLARQLEDSLINAGINMDTVRREDLGALEQDQVFFQAKAAPARGGLVGAWATGLSDHWGLRGPRLIFGSPGNALAGALLTGQWLLALPGVDHVLVMNIMLAGQSFSGDGAAALVLKRLSDCRKHQKRYYAAIDGLALKSATPSQQPVPVQEAVMETCARSALSAAGCRARNITYLELSGSSGHDSVVLEMNALAKVYQQGEKKITVGSSQTKAEKEAACPSGAGLIKVALSLFYRVLPENPPARMPVKEPNRIPELFQPVFQSLPWDQPEEKRMAAVNYGSPEGTCAHLILSEPVRDALREHLPLDNFAKRLFILSGGNQDDLMSRLKRLGQKNRVLPEMAGLASSCYAGHQQQLAANLPACFTIVLAAKNHRELDEEIAKALTGIPLAFNQQTEWCSRRGSYFTPRPLGQTGKTAFVYSLGGMINNKTLHKLLYLFPGLMAYFENTSKLNKLERDFLASKKPSKFDLIRGHDSLEGSFVQQTIATRLYTDILTQIFKLEPDLAFGCSFGEVTMLSTFNVLVEHSRHADITLKDILQKTISGFSDLTAISKEFRDRYGEGHWQNYVVSGDMAALTAKIQKEPKVFLTILGSPKEAFMAGHKEDCERLIRELNLISFNTQPYIAHTPLAEPVITAMLGQIEERDLRFNRNRIGFRFSHAAQDQALSKERFKGLLKNTLGQQVDFIGQVESIYAEGARLFIDIGPHDLCERWIKTILKDKPHLVLAMDKKGVPEEDNILYVIGRLLSHHLDLDGSRLFQDSSGKREAPVFEKDFAPADLHPEADVKSSVPFIHQAGPATGHARTPEPVMTMGQAGPVRATMMDQHLPAAAPARFAGRRFGMPSQVQLKYLEVQNLFMELLLQNRGVRRDLESALGKETADAKDKQSRPDTPATPKSPGMPGGLHKNRTVLWDRDELVETTNGSLAKVWGEGYAEADGFVHRLRMPSPPFLLVSRITRIEGQAGRLEPCMLEMEYDIPGQAWYAVNDQIPHCIAPESPHAVILLLSYIGADNHFQYQLKFRITDSRLVYRSNRPLRPKDCIRNIIRITSFIKSKEKLLIFFEVEVFVNNRLLMIQQNTSGMFSPADLNNSQGVKVPGIASRLMPKKTACRPLLNCAKKAFSGQDLDHLKNGLPHLCFGKDYVNRSGWPRLLCAEKMDMLSRITLVDLSGGTYGCGCIMGEKDLDEDHWAFQAHFKNDPVMPGTLMVEGGLQALEVYLHYLGWFAAPASGRPPVLKRIPGLEQVSTFRGQVGQAQTKLVYRIDFKELTDQPVKKVIADIKIHHQDKMIMLISDWGATLEA